MKDRERYLKQLLELLSVLDSKEVELAKKHILAYETNLTVGQRKMFQLFEEVVRKKNTDYDWIKLKVSNLSSKESFDRLIRRTINRIQESLSINVNIKRKGAYSDIYRERFHLRKQLIEAYILQGKGLSNRSLSIYRKIINRAKSYELYDEAIEALTLIQSINIGVKSASEFDKINAEINRLHKVRMNLNNLKLLRRRYFSEIIKESKSNQLKFLHHSIHEGKRFLEEIQSYNIQNIVLSLEMELFYLFEDLKNEMKIGIQLINLLENNKSIYSIARISTVNASLANSIFGSYFFREAYGRFEKAMKWVKETISYNVIIVSMKQAICLIFLEENKKSLQEIENLRGINLIKNHKVYLKHVLFYKAINHFCLHEFKESNQILFELEEIGKDSEGWNAWIRILKIMISIEREEYEVIDFDIENLRKYLERNELEMLIREKRVLIILTRLALKSFSFSNEDTKIKEALLDLQSTEKPYKWNPNSPELILFHDWYLSKKERRAYEPNFDRYQSSSKIIVDDLGIGS